MSRWSYTSGIEQDVTFVNSNGQVVTRTLRPGDSFESSDACEMLRFIGSTTGNFSEEHPGVYKGIRDACAAPVAAPNPNPTPGGATGANDGNPGGVDGSAQQGAPSTSTGGQVVGRHEPSANDSRQPANQAADPNRPASDGEVHDTRAAQTGSDAEGDEAVRRARRNDPMPGQPHPTHSGEDTRAPSVANDPVDLFSGALTIARVDLELPAASLPLRIVRFYRSGRPYFGPFGFGWDHSWNVYVRVLADGRVARWTGRLHEDLFTPTGAGFEPPRGVHERLEAIDPGLGRYRVVGTGGLVLAFERPPGWTEAERIPLVEVRDRHGNAQRLTYDTDNRLARVLDDDGRALLFHYGGCGLLEAVEDHTGRLIEYHHASDVEHLVTVVAPPTARYPQGVMTQFEYDHHAAHPAQRHNLLRITDPDGRTYVQCHYIDDTSSWGWNRICHQLVADRPFSYAYEPVQVVPQDALFADIAASRTLVQAPDGGVRTYTFNYRGDLIDERLRLVRDRSFRVVARQWRYDEAGNVRATIGPDGMETVYTFDAAHADPSARGNLLRIERRARVGFPAPSRIVLRAAYEPRHQLVRETHDETNSVTRYAYDFDTPTPGATGRLVSVDLPAATLPDGSVQQSRHRFESDARGRLTAHVTPEGIRHELEYGITGSSRGLLVRRRLDVGGLDIVEELGHDALGRVATETDGTGAVTQSSYDALGRLVSRVLPAVSGATAVYEAEYDGDGFLLASRRPRGQYADSVLSDPFIEDRMERDVLGHIRRLVVGSNTALPRVVVQTTDFEGQVTRSVDPSARTTERCYDERGLLLSETVVGADGTKAARRDVYDRAGRLVRQLSGPLEDRVTDFEYDAFGRLAVESLPNGSERRLTWGANELLELEQLVGDDGTGTLRLLSEVRHEYDERSREVRRIEVAFVDDPTTAVDLVTVLEHDRDDRLVRRIDARMGVTSYGYDGMDRIVREEDPRGNLRRMEYDAAHRPVLRETVDIEPAGAVSRTWRTEYDERGRQLRAVEPDSTAIELVYDDRDLVVVQVDPAGVERHRKLGLLGELQELVVDPAGLAITHRWEHDALARPVRYVDPTGEVATNVLDGLGRVVRMDVAGGARSVRQFGVAGRLDREMFAGGATVDYGYDAAGRLASMSGSGPGVTALSPHTFRYDGFDRVVEAVAGALPVRRAYDSFGRLVSETCHGVTLGVSYDDLNGLVDHFWSDGRRERWQIDENGTPTSIARIAAGVLGGGPAQLADFSTAGPTRLAAATLATTLDVAVAYDRRLRLTDLRYASSGAPLHETAYRYDATSRRRVVRHRALGLAAQVHRFDTDGRLVRTATGFAAPALGAVDTQASHDLDIAAFEAAAAGAPRVLEQDYDAADGRLAYRETGQPDRAYTLGPGHRVVTAGAEGFTHTADGGRASDGDHTYTFDAVGRVTSIQGGGGATLVRISYDALGRVASVEEGGTTRLLSYLGGALRQESVGGAAARQYTQHPFFGTPLAIHVPGSTWLPIWDGHFDCVAVADTAGAVLERYRYEPFGAPSVLSPAGAPLAGSVIGFEPRFGGMRWLTGASRYLASRRLLDPRHGLFLSPDPMGHLDSPNLYAFAAQNPVDGIDPEGDLFWFVIAVIAVGAAVGGGVNAARQGVQIAEGSRTEFSWGEVGTSAALGGALAPVVVFAPEVALPLAGLGVASSVNEFSQGNYATGTFDLVTSIAPFGFTKVRTNTFGPGTAFSWAAGRGPIMGASQRWGNVVTSGQGIVSTVRNIGSRRFYRGTTYYEALQAEQDNALDLAAVLQRQTTAAAPPRLGPGLYFTNEPGSSAIPGSAQYWADLHGLQGRAGGPAVLEATVSWWQLRGLRNTPGVQLDLPQPRFAPNRANVESFFPFDPQSPNPAGAAVRFNELATWRLWDPQAQPPAFVVPWTPWPIAPWFSQPERGGKK